eukprot:m.62896 g.62896  ORF g.62896 m.62896 type:complete len:214 (-) comp8047_c1_seq1:976-1617(-)
MWTLVLVVSVGIVLWVTSCVVDGRDAEMTAFIKAGEEECFFETIEKGSTLQFEFEVTRGGGEKAIDYRIFSPSDHVRDQGKRLSTGHFDIGNVQQAGEWKFCFSNPFTVYRKAVYILLIIDGEADMDEWDDAQDEIQADESAKSILESAKVINSNLRSVIYEMHQNKGNEIRDRELSEQLNFEVMAYTVVEIFFSLFLAGAQVFFIRSLFDDL